MGDFGSNYCWTFVGGFIMIYCTNTLRVSAAVVGFLMMISKFLDGFTDVIFGMILDRTHSKMGKARFWYFWSAFPTAISVFLLFNVPGTFSDNTKYAWVFIVYVLMGAVFYTMSNISYSALTALCTKNSKDRVAMGSYRFVFSTLATQLIFFATSDLVERFGGGQQGWRIVSLLYSIICLVFLLIPVFVLRELPESELESEGKKSTDKQKIGILQSLVILVKNKYFIIILAYYLILYIIYGVEDGLGVYYTTYSLGNASLLGMISLASLPSTVVLAFLPNMLNKVEYRKLLFVGGSISLLGSIIGVIAGFNGVFSVYLAGRVLRTIGIVPLNGGINAMIAAADDYSQLKFGHRVTGTIYSCSSIGIKVGYGVGAALCGTLITLSQFDPSLTTQSGFTLTFLSGSFLVPCLIYGMLVLVVGLLMNVENENKKLREMQNIKQ